MTKFLQALSLLAAGMCMYAYVRSVEEARASRNASGTYSTPNTFVTGTTISSTNVNANFSDIATEMTDSLDRSGKGGMLAALRGIDGTVAAPAYSFTNETGTGFFRNASNDLRLSIGGTSKGFWNTTGFGIGGAATERFSVFPSSDSDAALMAGFRQSGGGLVFGVYDESGGSTTPGPGSATLKVGNTSGGGSIITSGSVSVGTTLTATTGLTVGTSGTPISGSFAGSASLTPGSVTANTCSLGGITSPMITVTGAATTGVCMIQTAATDVNFAYSCLAKSNGCDISFCNVTTSNHTPSSGTYYCRVFNP